MAVTGETLFRFVTKSPLLPLITTSLEVIHGQDNDGENSFVAIVERESLYGFQRLYKIVCVSMSLSKIEWSSFFFSFLI